MRFIKTQLPAFSSASKLLKGCGGCH